MRMEHTAELHDMPARVSSSFPSLISNNLDDATKELGNAIGGHRADLIWSADFACPGRQLVAQRRRPRDIGDRGGRIASDATMNGGWIQLENPI